MSITFTFNGVSCEQYNLKVKSSTHRNRAKKKIEFIEIPGRTGDLIIDDGTFENLKVEVVCYLDARNKSLNQLVDSIDRWLNDPRGYQELNFSDGTKLKAVFNGQLDIQTLLRQVKTVNLIFSCIPNRGD